MQIKLSDRFGMVFIKNTRQNPFSQRDSISTDIVCLRHSFQLITPFYLKKICVACGKIKKANLAIDLPLYFG
ncbi:MAG: hypothetical protein K0R65_2632 [Crocinitomicaceae bacterium]|jgi:hypothetical protein|nr:hypothetical protein [Crocinitomicaceae bacterium]